MCITADHQYLMQVAVGYFDESTDESTHEACYVVAGFIASNLATACLDLRWKDLLDKYNLRYFKASELSAGEGEFKQFRDDPAQKGWKKFSDSEKGIFDEIKIAFTDAIVSARGLCGVGAAIILPDYNNILIDYPASKERLAKPYFLCSKFALMEAGLQVACENEHYSDQDKVKIRPVFDSHEDYSGAMKTGFDWFCRNNPISSKYLLPPYYEDDKEYLCLQAADNLAFEIRKFVVGIKGNRPERKALTRMREAGSITIYKLDYDALKIFIEAQDHPDSTLKPLSYTLADIMR